jgi:hypothetical protein
MNLKYTFDRMKISWLSILITIIGLVLFIRVGRWSNNEVIQGDSHGYYSYLPAIFTYHDLSFSWHKSLSEQEKNRYWLYPGKENHALPKMTSGLAIAWAPGFMITKLIYELRGKENTGWEQGYQVSLGLTALAFLVLGLSALLSFLKKRFSDLASYLSGFLIFFATNLMYYTIAEPGMGHVYSFSIFCLSMYFLDVWLRSSKSHGLWIAALLFGWLVLIRPTNAVFSLVFIGFYLDNPKALSIKAIMHLLVGILPVIPQLLFWKYSTGDWLHYSYGDEKIYWLNSHISGGLLSFRNGWFIYTPIAFFSLLFLLIKSKKNWTNAFVLLTLIIHIYVVFAWWCWYYGDSLSIRPMIDAYALVAIGIAIFMEFIIKQKRWLRLFVAVFLVLLVYNNCLQYQQYSRSQLTGSTMTKAAFDVLFFNADPPGHLGLIGAYEKPDNDRLRLGLAERTVRDTVVEKTWLLEDFEQKNLSHLGEGFRGKGQWLVPNFDYSHITNIAADSLYSEYDRILELSVWVKCDDFEETNPVFIASFSEVKNALTYQVVEIAKLGLKENAWQQVKMYIKKPEFLPENCVLELYVWKRTGFAKLGVDDFKVRQLDCPFREKLQ